MREERMTSRWRRWFSSMTAVASMIGVAFLLRAIGLSDASAQTPPELDRLAALGKVWGFLKYYHPRVAAGSIDWDSVAVATVPKVRAARTSAEFRETIQSLLNAAGEVRPCVEPRTGNGVANVTCRPAGPDSLRANLDLRWLSDTTLFGSSLVRQLELVRDNRHQGPGRYVAYEITAMFGADNAFRYPEYPGEGQRLLALYRFWNAARYFFPYMSVNDGDWNAVLPEFIPRLIAATDATDYHLIVLELTTRLNDAHVGAGSSTIFQTLGSRSPAFEARSIEGKIVVWKLPRGTAPTASEVRVGDVITHVAGRSVEQRRRDLARYVAAGNPAVFERKLVELVLRTRTDSVPYTVERGGQSLTQRVAMAPIPRSATRPTYPVAELARMLPNSSIGYIDMGDLDHSQVDSALAIVKNATGIIMDVRNYPRGTMYQFARFFNPDARPFARFTAVDPTYPGQVLWKPPVMAGLAKNADYFRGRVAILVDERTQSHAEFTVMALRTAPDNKVIGSQTAGADGNVTQFYLPGGIVTLFTGLGVYYPDGRPTQRVGIVPDIEVRPTLAGLRAGRDEVLERATEYIRTGR
jgi:carboxyl-terminal processing protease